MKSRNETEKKNSPRFLGTSGLGETQAVLNPVFDFIATRSGKTCRQPFHHSPYFKIFRAALMLTHTRTHRYTHTHAHTNTHPTHKEHRQGKKKPRPDISCFLQRNSLSKTITEIWFIQLWPHFIVFTAAQYCPFLCSVLLVIFLDDILVPSFTRKQLYVSVSLGAVRMLLWPLPSS